MTALGLLSVEVLLTSASEALIWRLPVTSCLLLCKWELPQACSGSCLCHDASICCASVSCHHHKPWSESCILCQLLVCQCELPTLRLVWRLAVWCVSASIAPLALYLGEVGVCGVSLGTGTAV